MARALLITPAISAQIKAAIARARENPTLWEHLKDIAIDPAKAEVTLADRKPGHKSIDAEHVLIPMGYQAAISFEYQPAGLCRHLSISVDTKGRVPTSEAAHMIAKEFGFSPRVDAVWLEEFEPGHHAVNLVEVVREGTA